MVALSPFALLSTALLGAVGVYAQTPPVAYVVADLAAGTFSPSSLTNVAQGTLIVVRSNSRTRSFALVESQSISSPCIQALPNQRQVNDYDSIHSGHCPAPSYRTGVDFVYNTTKPLTFYGFENCRRGMVLSINLGASDVTTLQANAKSASGSAEQFNDLSIIPLSYLPAVNDIGCSTRSHYDYSDTSGGAIAGIVVGTLALAGGLVFFIIWLIRRRRQRLMQAARRRTVLPFSPQGSVPTTRHADNKYESPPPDY